jgi:hypothetical protein
VGNGKAVERVQEFTGKYIMNSTKFHSLILLKGFFKKKLFLILHIKCFFKIYIIL